MEHPQTFSEDKVLFGATTGFLAACIALGGGQGGLGETLLQLGALVLIPMAAMPVIRGEVARGHLCMVLFLMALVIAMPLFQLLPGWGFTRPGPERALWGLLPALSVFIAASVLAPWRRRQLLLVVIAMSVLGLVLGLMQLAGGSDSPLRFYGNTNRSGAVGWFANRNHLASLLVLALPLSIVLAVRQLSARLGGRGGSLLSIVAGAGAAVLLILGIALTRSRAGVMLGIAALVLSLPVLMTVRRRQGSRRLVSAIVIVALVLTVQFALFGVLARFQADPLADLRWQIAAKTLTATDGQLPMGTGLGSFRAAFTGADDKTPSSTIINHAHNDYLELWLEAGWLFPAAAGVFLASILVFALRAWRHVGDHTMMLWPAAALMSLMLGLVHSAVDYPLRTTALQAVVAILLAVLAPDFSETRAPQVSGQLPLSRR